MRAILAALLVTVSVLTSGHLAMWSILAVGLFNSIMFPCIFTMGIAELGPLTGDGSGIMNMAIEFANGLTGQFPVNTVGICIVIVRRRNPRFCGASASGVFLLVTRCQLVISMKALRVEIRNSGWRRRDRNRAPVAHSSQTSRSGPNSSKSRRIILETACGAARILELLAYLVTLQTIWLTIQSVYEYHSFTFTGHMHVSD